MDSGEILTVKSTGVAFLDPPIVSCEAKPSDLPPPPPLQLLRYNRHKWVPPPVPLSDAQGKFDGSFVWREWGVSRSDTWPGRWANEWLE